MSRITINIYKDYSLDHTYEVHSILFLLREIPNTSLQRYSRLPTPYSLLPTPYSLLPIPIKPGRGTSPN
ncbi:MAG: hypothetical protein F6J90_12525 [Moorea sp. SIOASIH]|uniref:hypothetical protein n=1 Tax=Moorena sp. SIOASIH TaxID=2607817 RepID=UPI0013B8256A|nr:hypothetical protein [Moorena sp. SIOASIH]NEO37092.1 hypothetical protein [Moorena sp. SIOASIH]